MAISKAFCLFVESQKLDWYARPRKEILVSLVSAFYADVHGVEKVQINSEHTRYRFISSNQVIVLPLPAWTREYISPVIISHREDRPENDNLGHEYDREALAELEYELN
jgi:hypothetical protein